MSRGIRPLAAFGIAALILISVGCSSDSGEDDNADNGGSSNAAGQAVKFAECMRDNGVSEFPDPDASGALTIDAVVNGSSIDPDSPVWTGAIDACKDLQPPGFTGDEEVTDEEQEGRLAFAQCMRDNGVEDFPDPAKGDPMVDTNRIPSSATESGMTVLNAAMQKCGDHIAGQLGP
jgi:hypothetical protein